MGTLHQLKQDSKSYFPEQELAAVLCQAVNAKLGTEATFQDRESMALQLANEATRHFIKDDLEAIVRRQDESDYLEIEGKIYKKHEPGSATYHSLCGGVSIERWSYRETGMHNGPTVIPLELEAGLVQRGTPALGYRIALGYAKHHMRSCEEDMIADKRCPPSRSTLERMGKAIGSEFHNEIHRIEAKVRRTEKVPEEAVAISIGLDRTSVPMEETVEPGDEVVGRRKKRAKPYERKQPPMVNVNYRMAYVGTFSFHDIHGEALVSRRYAIGAHEDPKKAVDRLMADIRQALKQNPKLPIGVIQDGAPEMWNLIENGLSTEPSVTKWIEGIDRYHLNERLGSILRAVEDDASVRRSYLDRWNKSLDSNNNAIYAIRQWVRDLYENAIKLGDEDIAKKFEDDLTYLENNASRMRYAQMKKVGLPVGSGITEGACKSVIGKRTKSGGQRWRPKGLQAALTLRSIYMSDRLPRSWQLIARQYRKEVRNCA